MLSSDDNIRVAIVYPGDRAARDSATVENNRFSAVFAALSLLGVTAEPAVYHDDFVDQVRRQLEQVDSVLVWVNPIESDGRDRSLLDAMLRQVAATGRVFVSAHPDVIVKLGTKEVIYRTREFSWGCDTIMHTNIQELQRQLAERLASGQVRVLKQNRGNGGNGVWKVQLEAEPSTPGASLVEPETLVRVHHAMRGCTEEVISFADFLVRCEQYFSAANGRIIDQLYQPRLPEGTIRCYLVHDRVAGFGFQAVNALHPTLPAGQRVYFSPDKDEFQRLKQLLETEWVPALQRLLNIDAHSLPIIWDIDFLFGPRDASGQDTYVLCEINVSCVVPFPDSAVPVLAQAAKDTGRKARGQRHSFD